MPVFFFLPPLVIWLFWYVRIVTISRLASTDRERAFLYVIPVIAMVALLLLLVARQIRPRRRRRDWARVFAALRLARWVA